MNAETRISPYRWRVISVLSFIMVIMPFFDISDYHSLINCIAGVCFLLAAILIEYKTRAMSEENPTTAISILLIPVLFLIILSIAGVTRFLSVLPIYCMGFLAAGDYPGKQKAIPQKASEWLLLLLTILAIAVFIMIMESETVRTAIHNFLMSVTKGLY